MMAEYIEREAILSKLRERDLCLCVTEYDIKSVPAADVAPVRHGHWYVKWDAERDPKRYFIRIVCSSCGLITGQKSNYCPHCGAKMDGGDDDGKR